MAKFITSNELNADVEKLFLAAEKQLILISPYVKLHSRYESALYTKILNPDLKIIIVFGKNESDPAKSITSQDLKFFAQFPNIEIRYEKRLHAKYYANETEAIITSMNLYSFSQDNNIESGIRMSSGLGRKLNKIIGTETIDDQAWDYFERVIGQSTLLFKNVPVHESTMLGLSQRYTGFKNAVDEIHQFVFKSKKAKEAIDSTGYCIITGKKIRFNIEQPYLETAIKGKLKTIDTSLRGSFCHFSGEPGDTTLGRPILRKNWKQAQIIADMK